VAVYDVQTRLITPICPHYAAEYMWTKIMKKEGFAIKAGWPMQTPWILLCELQTNTCRIP